MSVLKQAFYSLAQEAEEVCSRSTGDVFLQHLRHLYGFTHIAYLGINIPNTKAPGFYFHNTYSDAWRLHYHSKKFLLVDPVVRRGLLSLVPQDWGNLDSLDDEAKQVFDHARDFGVYKQGLSFPTPGMHGETAVFSVTAEVSQRDWAHLKKVAMRDPQTLAGYFHQSVLKQSGLNIGDDGHNLSERELECLRWAGIGKSAWETSVILKISENTVKFHLANARYKLHCVTTTQAVARAINLHLIDLD